MTDRHNHCVIANSLSVCSDPIDHCTFFKAGYDDCFYHKDQRCCNSRAILDRVEQETIKKTEVKA